MVCSTAQLHEKLTSLFATEGLIYLGAARILPQKRVFERFAQWIAEGRHGQMSYLTKHQQVREDPRKIFPGAQVVLCFGLFYELSWEIKGSKQPLIAGYACYRDYHEVIKKSAARVLAQLSSLLDVTGEERVFVDTAPLFERELAVTVSSGFWGLNHCFIHPQWGSSLLLGEIVLTSETEGLIPQETSEHCAPKECMMCMGCIASCPTGALDAEGGFDARKCLSYLSIEYRGLIPREMWSAFQHYYYGCDCCQRVCPHNARVDISLLPQSFSTPKFAKEPDLLQVAIMDQKMYETLFGGTAMTRAKIHGLRRNALIAMFVTQDPRLDEALAQIGEHDHEVLKGTKRMILEDS